MAEVIKNKEGIDISRALHCLRPSAGLNDEIINQYLSLVQESAPKNVLVASTWLVKRLRNSNFDRKDGAGLLRLIIPVHHPRSHPSKQHWTLAILERECQEDRFRLVLLDSLCQQNITIPNLLELWLADLDLSEISVATPNPQQNYFSQDCGLFVLLAARLAASGVPMPSQVEVRHLMRSFRRRVLAEILAGKLDPAISDFEKFQENEKERQIEACTLKNFHQDVRKPLAIVLEGGKEFVNLISPITTTSSGDMIATGSFNSNTWEPSSTIDPKILSYQLPYSTMESAVGQNDEENTPKSLQIESMFVSSPETDKETVASPGESSVRSMPGLPTPAPSRSSSPVRCTPSECSTPHSAASPQSSSSSSHISSQSSNPGSPSSDGNTTISRGSLPKLGISSECSVGASSDRYAKTCRKSPHILAVPSECSTPDSASSDEPSQSPSSVASLETTPMKPLPIAWRMTVPLALDDLEALPSILESARTDHEEGAITISLPEANAYSQVDIDITHSTMVQSLTFHKWVITNNFETVEKQTRITLQPQSRMDIDPVGLEELVLLFEEHVQKGELTELDYVTDVLVTSRESRKQLDLPSSKITNPVGNALRYTSGRFDGIHTPMAYLSGGYGMAFVAP